MSVTHNGRKVFVLAARNARSHERLVAICNTRSSNPKSVMVEDLDGYNLCTVPVAMLRPASQADYDNIINPKPKVQHEEEETINIFSRTT